MRTHRGADDVPAPRLCCDALDGSRTHLDLELPFEQWLSLGAFVPLGLSLLVMALDEVPRRYVVGALAVLGTLATACMLARILVDFTYVLDNGGRKVLFACTVCGVTRTSDVCRFDQVLSVHVSGQFDDEASGCPWTYVVLLELPANLRLQVSAATPDHAAASALAATLAKHLGSPLNAPKPETRGEHANGGHPCGPRALGHAEATELGFFALSAFVNVAVAILLLR